MQNHENQIVLEGICHTVKPFWKYKKHVLCLSNVATLKCTEKRHHYWSLLTPPKTNKHESLQISAVSIVCSHHTEEPSRSQKSYPVVKYELQFHRINWNTVPIREHKQQSFEFETTKKTYRKLSYFSEVWNWNITKCSRWLVFELFLF